MICVVVFLCFIGQIISWLAWLNMVASPGDWNEKDRTKKNFMLLLVPLGYWYFVWVGIKNAWKFLVESYEGLK